METQDSDDNEKNRWEALRLAVIADDTEYNYWPAEEVNQTRNTFLRLRGSVPSLAALQAHYGDHLASMVQKIVADRVAWLQLQVELQGTNSPCHSCGNLSDLSYHHFGLARILKKERDWTGSLISVAASAVTLPLLGTGALYGSETSKTASIMRMRLVLCKNCLEQHKGLFGGFKVTSRYAQIHPLWNKLNEAGFTEFINAYDLANKWH
jgi:hypothetical protein